MMQRPQQVLPALEPTSGALGPGNVLLPLLLTDLAAQPAAPFRRGCAASAFAGDAGGDE